MLPVTLNLSDCPAPVPPKSTLRIELAVNCKSPVMLSVPATPVPPGLMVPWLIKPATPVPTAIVPVPVNIPLLVKPLGSLKVAPDATLIVPLLRAAGLTIIDPAVTLIVPLLVTLLLLMLKVCPVVLAMMLPLLVSAETLKS